MREGPVLQSHSSLLVFIVVEEVKLPQSRASRLLGQEIAGIPSPCLGLLSQRCVLCLLTQPRNLLLQVVSNKEENLHIHTPCSRNAF